MSSDEANNDAELSDAVDVLKALDAKSKGKALRVYQRKARVICAMIHPYMDLTTAFFAGIPEAIPSDGEHQVQDEGDLAEEIHVYNLIMQLGGFRDLVTVCRLKPERILALIAEITNARNAARSDDTGKLKSAILYYMHENPKAGSKFKNHADYEPLVPSDPKDRRGYNHLDTADLLCPLRLKEEFEADRNGFLDNVEDGTIQITADDFPSFLYESGTVYDEDNEDIGLFRGFLLVRVFRHIFTGPSSAIDPTSGGPQKSKAKLFNVTEVTGRAIAYASVQAYIALSSMTQWGSVDNVFELEELYETIVTMFEKDPDDRWVVETLDWWNEQVPGLRRVPSKKWKKARPDAPPRTRPPLIERIAAQRAQREASESLDHSSDKNAPNFGPEPSIPPTSPPPSSPPPGPSLGQGNNIQGSHINELGQHPQEENSIYNEQPIVYHSRRRIVYYGSDKEDPNQDDIDEEEKSLRRPSQADKLELARFTGQDPLRRRLTLTLKPPAPPTTKPSATKWGKAAALSTKRQDPALSEKDGRDEGPARKCMRKATTAMVSESTTALAPVPAKAPATAQKRLVATTSTAVAKTTKLKKK